MGGSAAKPIAKKEPPSPLVKDARKRPTAPAVSAKLAPSPAARQPAAAAASAPVGKVVKEKTQRRASASRESKTASEGTTLSPISSKQKDEAENKTAKSKKSHKKYKRATGAYIDGEYRGKKNSRTGRRPSGSANSSTKEGKEKEKLMTARRKEKDSTSKKEKKQQQLMSTARRKERTPDRPSVKRRQRDGTTPTESTECTKTTVDDTTKTIEAEGRRVNGTSKKDSKEKSMEEDNKLKTQDDKTNVTAEADDNTLVSDPPKRKKFADDKEHNVKLFLRGMITKGVDGLRSEFDGLRSETAPAKDQCTEFFKNDSAKKNRYKDVPCLDDTRVVLRDRDGDATDYIHANYCTTPANEHRFICTQGPTDNTFSDFWAMIYQEEVDYIVMLCNFVEMNKPKCGRYVPLAEGEQLTVDDYKIQCMAVHTHKLPESVCFRTLQFAKGDLESGTARKVTHVHWESWPDRSVPPIDHSIFKLLQRVMKSPKPVVVHCSAGIGRTGSMVVIQIAQEMLAAGESLAEGLAPVLKKLRAQRTMSVQMDNQYIFVHRVLLEYYKDVLEEDEIAQFCADYKKLVV